MTTQVEDQVQITRIDLDKEIPANNINLEGISVYPKETSTQVSLRFNFNGKKVIVWGFANPSANDNDPPFFLSLARCVQYINGQPQTVSTAGVRNFREENHRFRLVLNALFSNIWKKRVEGYEDIPDFLVPEVTPLDNKYAPVNDLGIVVVLPYKDISAVTGRVRKDGQIWPVALTFQNGLTIEVLMRQSIDQLTGEDFYSLDYYRRRLSTANTKGYNSQDNVYWMTTPREVNQTIINLIRSTLFKGKSAPRPAAQAKSKTAVPVQQTLFPIEEQPVTDNLTEFPF
jgi:hypothetical protein